MIRGLTKKDKGKRIKGRDRGGESDVNRICGYYRRRNPDRDLSLDRPTARLH